MDSQPGQNGNRSGAEHPASRRTRLSVPSLILAAAISSAGNNLTAIAIPWFVLVTTGSAARTGMVAFAGLLPIAVAGIAGGAIVDRFGPKPASVVSDIASGVTVAMIPTLYLLDALEFWHLLVLAFLGALLDVPGGAARQTMVPGLARRIGMPLERINAAYQVAQFSASVAGPILAGVLIVSLGAASVLYVNMATFVVSALLVAFGVEHRRSVSDDSELAEHAAGRSTFSQALDGMRFLIRDRVLSQIAFVSIGANFLFSPLFAVVFPVYVREVFDDPRALGFLVASFGVGSVLGTIWYGAYGPTMRRFPVLAGGLTITTVGLFSLPLAASMALGVAAGFIVGIALGPVNAIAMVVLQERAPESILGRVYGAVFAISQIATPLGVVVAGFAIEGFSVRQVMVAIAAGFAALVAWIVINPVFREMERPESQPSHGLEGSGA